MSKFIETLSVTSLGARGEGISEHEGARIFVARTLPGETIRARIDGNRGRLEEVLVPSPERVDPSCAHFFGCGGCQLQHVERDAYQAWKRELVETALRRVGLETEVSPLVVAAGAGRRRVNMHGNKTGAGLNALRSHEIHDLDSCPLLVPALKPASDITRACYAAIGDCDVSITATASGLDVSIRAKRHSARPALTKLANRFALARLVLNGEDIILRRPPEIAMGTAIVRLPSGTFLQATEAGEEALAHYILDACKGAKRVADLFCGVGPFALRLAENAKTYAIDSDEKAVAACNAALSVTPGLKSIGAEVRDLVHDPLVASELKPFNAVVFDPPRAGAEAQARELALSKVPVVVAISCNPVSFARDAAILVEGGYRLENVTPIDQFTWSAHIEIAATFRR